MAQVKDMGMGAAPGQGPAYEVPAWTDFQVETALALWFCKLARADRIFVKRNEFARLVAIRACRGKFEAALDDMPMFDGLSCTGLLEHAALVLGEKLDGLEEQDRFKAFSVNDPTPVLRQAHGL